MAIVQKYYRQFSDGVEEGYISDTIYNYIDNKICEAMVGGQANNVVGENGPIPFGYAICRGTKPTAHTNYNTGTDAANGQYVNVGVKRKAIGKINKSGNLPAGTTAFGIDGVLPSIRLSPGDCLIVESETGTTGNEVKASELILIKTVAATGQGAFDLTTSRGIGSTLAGKILDDADIFLVHGGPINMVGVAILDPRLPAVTLHGPMENKIPNGQPVNCLWFGDVNVRTYTEVSPGDPVSVWVGKGKTDVTQNTSHKIGDRVGSGDIVGMSYGSFSNEEPDLDIIRIPHAEWREKTKAGGIGKIRLALPSR